jgi:hypothetical protein
LGLVIWGPVGRRVPRRPQIRIIRSYSLITTLESDSRLNWSVGAQSPGEAFCRPCRDSARLIRKFPALKRWAIFRNDSLDHRPVYAVHWINSERTAQLRKPSRAGAPSLPSSALFRPPATLSRSDCGRGVIRGLFWLSHGGRRAREKTAVWKAPLLGLAPTPDFGTGIRLTRRTAPWLQKSRCDESPDQCRRKAGIFVGAEVTSSLTAILAGGAEIGSLPLAFRASFRAGRSFERTCSNSFTASASSFLSASM